MTDEKPSEPMQRVPIHDGRHQDCTVCSANKGVGSIEEQQARSLADAIEKGQQREVTT